METMMTKAEWDAMRNVDLLQVDRDALADINRVEIDQSLPREQRLASFVRQIGNPYCYRCGKAVVKVSFADTDATLEDCLAHSLQEL